MLNYRLKIGLIPERRDAENAKKRTGIFSAKKAVENKNRIIPWVWVNKDVFGL